MRGEIFHRVLTASFSSPALFPATVDHEVSRSRSLHSSERREMTDLLYDSIRWRRRIWGDIAPSRMDMEALLKAVEEAKALRASPPLAKWSSLSSESLARELSFPTWIIDRWVHTLGFTAAVQLALSLNEPAPITLRANIFKKDRKALQKLLEKEDIQTSPGKHSPWALYLSTRRNLQSLPAYRTGLFEVQDEASQVVVLETDAKADQLVIDACCGAGGKTLAFVSMMGNRGKVIAIDSDARKLPELEKRAKRAGAKIVRTHWVAQDDPNPLPEYAGQADIVLVDAPCSGLGVLRRRPWMKWEMGPAVAEKMPVKQLTLLSRFSSLVKPSGLLVYSTCTIHKLENEDVIEKFLKEKNSFRAEGVPRYLRPDIEGTDGFFIAKIKRI